MKRHRGRCRYRTHASIRAAAWTCFPAPKWHDCATLDATIRWFLKEGSITVNNLSGEHGKAMHPQALTEFGKYIDHCKGPRKSEGVSPENKYRVAA